MLGAISYHVMGKFKININNSFEQDGDGLDIGVGLRKVVKINKNSNNTKIKKQIIRREIVH